MHGMKLIGKVADGNQRHGIFTSRTAVVLLLSLWGPTGFCEDPEHGLHLHEPLPVSSGLGWSELIEQTLVNYPRFIELAARDTEANALSERGGKWFSGSPAIYASYLSDQAFDDHGMVEYELGVELPLWRWNERAAAQSLGTAASTESLAAAAALQLQIAGLLRSTLWDIERAVVAVALAKEDVTAAKELLRVVERRHSVGDLPLTDTLLARSALLERESVLINSDAALLDAEREYRSLTGLDRRPANIEETSSQREEAGDAHPWLIMASAAISKAEADLEMSAREVKGPPVLTLGSRRERGAFTNYYVDSIGVQVKVPFGGGAHASAKSADNMRALSAAKADRAQLVRQLELELHEAHHTLVVVNASLELARERFELADRRLQMSKRAFDEGEMTLFELLLQQQLARTTQMETARLETERRRAIAEINQALGESP